LTQENTIAKTGKNKMPVFTCSCGTKILIVPDLREMNKAIKRMKPNTVGLRGNG
jgi:hypothetical protein